MRQNILPHVACGEANSVGTIQEPRWTSDLSGWGDGKCYRVQNPVHLVEWKLRWIRTVSIFRGKKIDVHKFWNFSGLISFAISRINPQSSTYICRPMRHILQGRMGSHGNGTAYVTNNRFWGSWIIITGRFLVQLHYTIKLSTTCFGETFRNTSNA